MYCKATLIALGLALTTGCSSIVSQSEYPVAISSTPDSAKFTITNRKGIDVQTGVTPSTIILKASAGYFQGESYTITLTKEGYEPKTFTLRSTVDGWYFGNFLFGGLLGLLIVDPATGAMYKLPDTVSIAMDTKASDDKQEALSITTVDNLTEEQKKSLIPL
ncbi:hypothetical protein [Shewanella sedimentimangrovi]|uniref:PEGA domain-containing protein n=1 Tax=Shewanella sedimentimangrovi TaxID=2814293 RepID=A0ABX7R2Q8_9GAMM|nr:hypothetical protein [Shewanella sedimentimangrovi]QSX37365.1 hypothetical protein JYB85_00445 [Shewanella sedimentimangrovi]